MVIDIIALALAILLFVRGYKKGIIVAVCSVVALLLGMACALALSARLSIYLLDKGYASSGWAPVISYLVLFIGVVWLVRWLARLADNFSNMVLLGWANKSVGGLLYAAAGITLFSSILWLGNYAHIISPAAISGSKTYRFIEPVAPWVFDHMAKVLPFARDTFSDMRDFFEGVNKKLPDHVGAH